MSFDIKHSRFKSNPNWKLSFCEKLLGVKFNHKLTFDQQFKILGIKANAKLRALARFIQYMGLAKKNEFLFFCTIQLLSLNMDNS